MKVVAEFYNEYEAEIAKGRLESEGIESCIMNVVSAYPGIQMGRHGIQLMVDDAQYEAAAAILAEPAPETPSGE